MKKLSTYREYNVANAIQKHGDKIYDVDDVENCKELNPNNIDDKITIYERQVKRWFLEPAQKLCCKDNEACTDKDLYCFIVVMVAMSYVEGVEQYRQGEKSYRNSKEFFEKSIKRILGASTLETDFFNQQLNKIYAPVRCGLFHNGITGDNVLLNDEYKEAIHINNENEIIINPKELLNAITEDFDSYICELRDTSNESLRENFEKLFSI